MQTKTDGSIRTSYPDWTSLALVTWARSTGVRGLGGSLEANWTLVYPLLGSFPAAESFVSLVVGLAGVYELYFASQLYAARTALRSLDPEREANTGWRRRRTRTAAFPDSRIE